MAAGEGGGVSPLPKLPPAKGSILQPRLPHAPQPHSRFVGPEEEDLVFIGGGFNCCFRHLVNLWDTKDGVRIGEGRAPAPPDTRMSPTSWDTGVPHAASDQPVQPREGGKHYSYGIHPPGSDTAAKKSG